MSPDPRTIALYDAEAAAYASAFEKDEAHPTLDHFIANLPANARVLDLGCGPGRSSAVMADAGHNPDPMDAAPGMVRFAQDTYGLPARVGTFDDIRGVEIYDAVYANFSLLHAPRVALPRHFADIAAALKPGGLLHVGMKTGTGQARDAKDRLYTYVTEDELTDLFEAEGFRVVHKVVGEGKGFSGDVSPWIILQGVKRG